MSFSSKISAPAIAFYVELYWILSGFSGDICGISGFYCGYCWIFYFSVQKVIYDMRQDGV